MRRSESVSRFIHPKMETPFNLARKQMQLGTCTPRPLPVEGSSYEVLKTKLTRYVFGRSRLNALYYEEEG
jgi:hypothetical protein